MNVDVDQATNSHPYSLKKLALKLGTDGPVKTLSTPRKIQILYGGTYILKTTSAIYVWEHPYYPQYYVPKSELLKSSKENKFTFSEGEAFKSDSGTSIATQCTIKTGSKSTDQVLAFSDSLSGKGAELVSIPIDKKVSPSSYMPVKYGTI